MDGKTILNNLLNEFVDESFEVEDYIYLQKLINIIMKHWKPYYQSKYHSNMKLNLAYQYSLSFLHTISPKYSDALLEAMNNGVFHIESDKKNEKVSIMHINDDKTKKIDLYTRGNIEDSYTISHEFMHYLNADASNPTFTWSLMTEAFSITTEMLQEDYFGSFSNKPRDYKNNEHDILYSLLIKACQLDYEIKMIFAYHNYHYVDGYILSSLVDYNDFYALAATYDLESVLENEELNYDMRMRDIIGGVLSSYMYYRIKENPKLIDEFVELYDNINSLSFEQVLHYLDLEYLESPFLLLTDESIDKLDESYTKRIKRAYL